MLKNILVVVVGLVLIGAVYIFIKPSLAPIDGGGQVACTADAKQCPDGSYVGRTGPKCEFTPCPTVGEVMAKPVVFQCAEGKSLTATFVGDSVEFYVSDGRSLTFTFKKVPTDSDTETKYASEDGKTALWVSEQSAFLEENGKTTFSACVASGTEYPEVMPASEPPLPN